MHILREYNMVGDGCQAPGAIVLVETDNTLHPYVTWFRNDQDSEREGRPCYYSGNYFRANDFGSALDDYHKRRRRYDPTGNLHQAWRHKALPFAA